MTTRREEIRERGLVEQRLQAGAEVNQAILDSGPSDRVLTLVAQRTRRLADATVTVILVPEASGHLVAHAAAGASAEGLAGMRLSVDSLAGTLVQTGEACLVANLSADSRAVHDRELVGSLGPAYLVPLKVRGRVVGIIEVARDLGDRAFAQEELEAVRRFAVQTGLALERPVPLEREEGLRQTLDAVARTVVDLTDAVACSVHVLEPDLSLQSAGGFGLPPELTSAMDEASRMGASNPALDAMASQRPVMVTLEGERTLSDPRYGAVQELLAELGWTVMVCLPLISQTGTRGTLCSFFGPGKGPGDATLSFLDLIATHATTVLDNTHLLAAANRQAALEERQHLARELHDSLSQTLYGISLGVRTALTQLERDPASAREPLSYVLELAEAGLAEMQALISDLRPETLEAEGLAVALAKQAEAVQARHGIRVETFIEGLPESAMETHEALYRIAQEALQNIVKHASARRVELRLGPADGRLVLEVIDDGVGFSPDAAFPGHLGLRSMRERAAAVGGSLQVLSQPGTGTRVRASVPCFPGRTFHRR